MTTMTLFEAKIYLHYSGSTIVYLSMYGRIFGAGSNGARSVGE